MAEKGHCKHGEFDLRTGCPQCIAERMAEEGNTPESIAEEVEAVQPKPEQLLVKVQYGKDEGFSSREYTYYTEEPLKVGDVVTVPIRDTTSIARVSHIDVPELEIASFKDKVKIIPAGSIVIEPGTGDLPEPAAEHEPPAEAYYCPPDCRFSIPSGGPADNREVGGCAVVDKLPLAFEYANDPSLPLCPEYQWFTPPEPETAVALRPGEDIEAHGHYLEALKLRDRAAARVITKVEDLGPANDDLSLMSKIKKAMLEKRKSLLAPLEAQKVEIRATYDFLMAPILDGDKIYREKILDFNKEQERIRLEQEDINRKRLEAAQQEMALKGEITESVDLVEVAPEVSKKVSTDMGASGQRDNWKYEVVDFALLPDAYKMADTSQLNAIAKKHHDQKQVPGVRFYNEPIITVRAR